MSSVLQENEDEDYREWLKGQREELSDKKTESDLKYLQGYWNDPKLNSDELFLKDYILNRRYVGMICKETKYLINMNTTVYHMQCYVLQILLK